MVNWLYQSTLEVSLVIALVLIIRNPVRRILGAQVSYWLWSLPLLRLLFSDRLVRSEVITQLITLPKSKAIMAVYSGPVEPSSNQLYILLITWLIGMTLWIGLKLINVLKFKRLLKSEAQSIKSSDLLSPDLQQKFTRKVLVFQSPKVSSPLITGLFKPRIYLPSDFQTSYNLKQQSHILSHELTHAQRFDLWAQFLAESIKAIFWFNPLVHYAWHKFQADQEMACDFQVLKKASQKTRIEYGEALKQGMTAVLIPNSLTFFNHQHERFIMLAKHQKNTFLTLTGLFFLMTVSYLSLSHAEVSLSEKTDSQNGTIVSFKFKDIQLKSIVNLIADTSPTYPDIVGMDLLKDRTVTIEAYEVRGYNFLDQLLKDNGFELIRNNKSWQIVKLN